jgi:DNA excision repair protein ERCC-2
MTAKINYFSFFPYEHYRKEQERIIQHVEMASNRRQNVLLLAPNGTGKTVVALTALLPLAYEKNLKIIYTCRTHAQNTRVIKELVKISDHLERNNFPYKVNGISIRGRNEMCLHPLLSELNPNPNESMSICSDLRRNKNCQYFLNLIKKVNENDQPITIFPELFDKPIDAQELIDICHNKKICPYFLSKFLLSEMKLIICNYQWIFNPYIRETFLEFIGIDLEHIILIIDECHNIIDVATEINSMRITPYSLKLCLKDLEMYRSPPIMRDFIEFLLNHLNNKKAEIRYEEESINPSLMIKDINTEFTFSSLNDFKNFITDLQEYSLSIHEEKLSNGEVSRDYVGSIADFWLKWISVMNLDNYFFCYSTNFHKNKKNISMEIVALDPREIVIPVLKHVYTCLSLSGTANGFVYSQLMGFKQTGKNSEEIEANSPFAKKNIMALITEGIDTRKQNRGNIMYRKMIDRIEEVISTTPANLGIFCASYQVLKALNENGLSSRVLSHGKKLFIEDSGLSASENAAMINEFKSLSNPPHEGAILLGVCGGRNSEGEDYPGDFMNGVIIAGFPYHLPTPRVEAKIKYYDKVFNRQGWNFAYLYPAIQRANQASGRPIRKLTDKGVIVFMDSRFKEKYNWISPWMREEIEIIPDLPNILKDKTQSFWNGKLTR